MELPKSGLAGYLAVVRCGMDDIPIAFTNIEADARRALRRLTSAEFDRVCEAIDIDLSIIFHGSIYLFADGVLIGCKHRVPLTQLRKEKRIEG